MIETKKILVQKDLMVKSLTDATNILGKKKIYIYICKLSILKYINNVS